MGPQRIFGMTPWVRRLFVANLVVFLFQMTIFVDPRFLSTFGFVPLRALAQPWSFVTYMFLHGGPLHLAFNLLALFVFGPEVEERMGGGPFLAYYLVCGLGGAVLSFVLMQFRSVGLVIGASAAVYGVLLAFAWAAPDRPIYVFPLPEPIAAKWLVTFAAAVSLALAIFPPNDKVAHLAHLGGFGAGFLYLQVADWRLAPAEPHLRRAAQPSVLVGPRPAAPRRGLPRVSRPARAHPGQLLAQLCARPGVPPRRTGDRGGAPGGPLRPEAAARGRGRRVDRGRRPAACPRAVRSGLSGGPLPDGRCGRGQRGRAGGRGARHRIRVPRALHRPCERPDVRYGARAAPGAAVGGA